MVGGGAWVVVGGGSGVDIEGGWDVVGGGSGVDTEGG